MGSSLVRNMADSYTSSATPKKNYGSVNRMFVGTGNFSYLYFGNPIPRSAKVVSAKLHLYGANAWAGTITLSGRRVNGGWSANKITWNNDPGVVGSTASQTKTGAGKGTHWILDITTIMQEVADGSPWYGLRLTAGGATAKALFSMQATSSRRPWVELTWSDAPLAPTSLVPRDGQAVSTTTPTLVFNFIDVSGNKTMSGFQVQIATNALMTAPIHDSGTVASSIPHYDLSATAVVLAAGTTYYWRVKTQDGAGLWSAWSDVEPFVYVAPSVLDIVSPSAGSPFVEESSPPITWTFSGVQTGYEVLLYEGNVLLWDSGRVTSTNDYATIPSGKIKSQTAMYTVFVRVWDNQNRVATPGVTPYQEDSQDFVYQYNATVTPVSTLTATSDAGSPAYLLEFHRATPPDYFTLSRNGVVVLSNIAAAVVQDPVDSTKFTIEDYPPGRRDTTWEVVSVVNGQSSDDNPTVTKTVQRTFSWLQSLDDPDCVVALADPSHSSEDGEISAVMVAMDGPPALVTQSLYGETGSFNAIIANDITPHTAREMKDNLRDIRKIYGGHARLFFLDETMEVYIYHLKISRIGYPDGTTEYGVSFDWIQVDL